MSQSKNVVFLVALLSVIAIALSAIALFNANSAKKLALSEITVEEQNSLTTPVFDQSSQSWSFIALYELNVTNQSGPAATIEQLAKVNEGSGFIVPLKGQEILGNKIEHSAFLFNNPIAEIQANPRLLKDVTKNDIGESAQIAVHLENGSSKAVRFGVSLKAYNEENEPLAQVVLVSFKLIFDSGKTYTFRRGFPIPPIKPAP
jgi:hypothetical protein